MGFFQWHRNVVGGMILKKMAAVHFGTGLEDHEFEFRAQMVHGCGGAPEHVVCIFVFLGHVRRRFVCC